MLALKRKQKKQRQKQRRRQEAQAASSGCDTGASSECVGGATANAPGSAHALALSQLDERASRLNDAGFDETELGFSSDDLASALRVLSALGSNIVAFRSQPFKELRGVLHPIVEEQMRKYGVKGNDLKRKRGKEKDVTELKSLKEQDREWVNRAALRARRLAQLEELNKASGSALLGSGGQPLMLTHMGEVDEAVQEMKMHRVADGAVELSDEEEAAQKGEQRRLNIPITCYTCKRPFRDLHFFYDQLCPACAALNYQKRNEVVDLSDRVALVTGARVKIGFRIALKLLRCGATVIATSRFAADCARRYSAEKDFDTWRGRLHCVGLDFRDLAALEKFCAYLKTSFKRLDIIINNACQTIRRPAQYYEHLLVKERAEPESRPAAVRALLAFNQTFGAGDTSAPALANGEGAGVEQGNNLPGIRVEIMKEEEEEEETIWDPVYDESKCTSGHSAVGEVHPSMTESCHESAQRSAGVMVTDKAEDKGGDGQVLRSGGMRTGGAAEMSQLVVLEDDLKRDLAAFPMKQSGEAVVDVNEQQLDLRQKNSWMLKLDEVSTGELAEVMAINAIAPSVINARLKTLMEASPEPMRFIVNVSAMEGKFYRYKSDQHPHTNMAKAALNMMTRTSAQDYVKSHIYMTAVDTGWINDEKPMEIAARHGERHNFQTPIDEIDAAARVLDPVISPLLAAQQGRSVEPPFGVFLKDFVKCEW